MLCTLLKFVVVVAWTETSLAGSIGEKNILQQLPPRCCESPRCCERERERESKIYFMESQQTKESVYFRNNAFRLLPPPAGNSINFGIKTFLHSRQASKGAPFFCVMESKPRRAVSV